MERVGVLTRAARRLDAAAAELEPLGVAERGLAVLTRARLGGLIAPGRGDEALATALARGTHAGGGGTEVEPRPLRRLAALPVFAGPRRALPAAEVPQRGRTAVVVTAAVADGARMRPGPPAPVVVRRFGAPAAPGEMRRRTFGAPGAEAPVPPRSFGAAMGAAGLEWAAPRVLGGTEAAETPLVDGVPDAASPSQWAAPPGAAAQPRQLPVPAEPARAIPTVEIELVPEAHDVRSRHMPATVVPRSLPEVDGYGLGALVRAWQDPASTPKHAEHAPNLLPVENADTATSTSTPTPRTRPRDRAAEREDETLAFGDALGRVLVAELRRYGIEVDAG